MLPPGATEWQRDAVHEGPGAEIALAAVDEGLLSLAAPTSWQLLEAMMQRRPEEVLTSTAQSQVIGKRHFGRKSVPHGGGGGKSIRVTVVATGLGAVRAAAMPRKMEVIRTGTDNVSMEIDYGNLELPAVIRRTSRTTVEAMSANGMSTLDIPAFLRKQAD